MSCKIKGLPQILLHVPSRETILGSGMFFEPRTVQYSTPYSTNFSIRLLLSYVASQPTQICHLT